MTWRFDHAPEEDKADTSLRFTDVLFGFVIKELFTRLSDWSRLTPTVLAHLIAGTVLVLGSYIGFRKSLNRGNFKLFFFNLPLLRFSLDQMMVALYFRLATVTPHPLETPVDDLGLAQGDLTLLAWIFGLYVAWDGLSWWMASGKYPVMEQGQRKPYPRGRLVISLSGFLIFAGLRVATQCPSISGAVSALGLEGVAIVVLIAYRVLKDAYV